MLAEGVGAGWDGPDVIFVVVVVAADVVREGSDPAGTEGVDAGWGVGGRVLADTVGRDGPAITMISSLSTEVGTTGVAGETGNCVFEAFGILGVSGRISKVLVLAVGFSGETDPTTLDGGLFFFALG